MNKEYFSLNGKVFVVDDEGIKAVKDDENIDLKLKTENINEGIFDVLLAKYNKTVTEKKSRLSEVKELLKIAKAGSKKRWLVCAVAMFLIFSIGSLFFNSIILYFLGSLDFWYDIFGALKTGNFGSIYLIIMFNAMGLASAFGTLSIYSRNKKNVVALTEEQQTLEDEIPTLEREQAQIEEYAKAKETTEIEKQGEFTSLEGFNWVLDNAFVARLQRINELEDVKKTLLEIVEGQEFETFLSKEGLTPEETKLVKEEIGKRISFQPIDQK